MLGLSIRQPRAGLIAVGILTCDQRSWSTPYRGPILIHASEQVDPATWADPVLRLLFQRHCRCRQLEDAPRGAFLALAALGACCPPGGVFSPQSGKPYLTADDARLIDVARTTAVLRFADVRPLPRPVYARGGPGLFDVAAHHAEAALKQLGVR